MFPYVTVNLAMSADGKLSTTGRRQVKISGQNDFRRVDILKAENDAIMVGIGTVLADDPSLTVKSPELKEKRLSSGRDENPVRIIVDSKARTPCDAEILHKGPGKRIIAVSKSADQNKIEELGKYAEIIQAGDERVDLRILLEKLAEKGIEKLMVEGGGSLIWSLFEENLVDEYYTCIGNIIIGGASAPTPADGTGFVFENEFTKLEIAAMEKIDAGVLLRWKVIKN
ncbi:2,5-diamino-6-(ribosylamino)-4(3H)-pyrimidinone 5'-phosphate reductase [Methanolacinia paynteri]|uniref:2,5-diamino-6-(ribosylamino)-4(3H)-pyrimidinone 5'-phosphate reductase n=1 Tax=Methanolacinia paynteri TaxID=230356 RepID=UPI00064F8223|nr:2,5-diamino-6-(ribosylamino)-4(3H)-pyrimidinone 5'-phosphate reductase [Methanolacinia paynteri]